MTSSTGAGWRDDDDDDRTMAAAAATKPGAWGRPAAAAATTAAAPAGGGGGGGGGWGSPARAAPTRLTDVMAEQWAMANDGDVPAPPAAVDDKAAAASVSSDEALARELQRQFDAEALANGATPLRAAATPPAGPASAALPPVPPEVDVDVDADYALALYLQGELDRQEAAAAEQLARRRNGNANAKGTPLAAAARRNGPRRD